MVGVATTARPAVCSCRQQQPEQKLEQRHRDRRWARPARQPFVRVASAAAAAVLLAVLAPWGIGAVPLSDWHEGIATNYGGVQDGMNAYEPSFGTLNGACGYGQLDRYKYPYWSVAAFSPMNSFSMAGPANACGQCFEIKCVDIGGPFGGRCSRDANQRSVVVTITDVCPECSGAHIDMQALTFNKIAPMEGGRINIQYRRVECTPPEPLKVTIDHNVGEGSWLRIVVMRAAGYGGISLVQMKGANSGWMGMTNKYGQAWEVPVTPRLPWDFRFVSDDKQELTAIHMIDQNGKVGEVPTGVQFALQSGGGVAMSMNGGGATAGGGSSRNSTGSALALGDAVVSTAVTNTGLQTQTIASGDGASKQGAALAASKKCPCQDSAPDSTYTCEQQKTFGKCSSSWMTAASDKYPNAFCAKTCGRCPAECSST